MNSSTKEKPTLSQEDLEAAAIEEAAAELAEHERRHREARVVIAHAEKRFEELEKKRTELSPKAFSGDPEASLELEGVDAEVEELTRSVRVAKSALPEFEGMIADAKEKLQKAQFVVAKRKATERREALSRLHARRNEAADALEALLQEEEKSFFPDRTTREINKWLRERFRGRLRAWLR